MSSGFRSSHGDVHGADLRQLTQFLRTLTKLEASLEHQNYVLQRLAEFELEATTECWRAARACLPLINATRPHDSGTDEDVWQARYKDLSEGHNRLLEMLGKHEIFLSSTVIEVLDGLGRVVRLELSNIRHYEHFKGDWWEQGEKNRGDFKLLCDALSVLVRARTAELRAGASAASKS